MSHGTFALQVGERDPHRVVAWVIPQLPRDVCRRGFAKAVECGHDLPFAATELVEHRLLKELFQLFARAREESSRPEWYCESLTNWSGAIDAPISRVVFATAIIIVVDV
jgi:hypothetical protein